MRGQADWSPEGKSLAVRAEVVTPEEAASHQAEDRGASGSGSGPGAIPFAFELRGVWPRRVARGPREPSPWIMIALVALIALIAAIGFVAWLNWPDVHRVGDLRVDVLIEGAWRFGKEAVSTD